MLYLLSCLAELAGVAPVGEPEQKDLYLTPDQLSGELLTLSLLPRSKWQTLLNLEVIKVRLKAALLVGNVLADRFVILSSSAGSKQAQGGPQGS